MIIVEKLSAMAKKSVKSVNLCKSVIQTEEGMGHGLSYTCLLSESRIMGINGLHRLKKRRVSI